MKPPKLFDDYEEPFEPEDDGDSYADDTQQEYYNMSTTDYLKSKREAAQVLVDDCLKHRRSGKLNTWEREFITNIFEVLDKDWNLSKKQTEILNRIWNKATKEG